MSEGSIGGQPSPHEDVRFVPFIPIEGPVALSPIKVAITPTDTIESIKEKGSPNKQRRADSPDLSEAQWLLWWAATSNQYTLQSLGGGDIAILVKVNPTERAPNPELVSLKQQNAVLELSINVLNSWAENLKQEAHQIKEKLKHDAQMAQDQEQSAMATIVARLEKLAQIDLGLAQGLGDYVSQVKAQKIENSSDLTFMLGTLSVGATVRFDYAAAGHIGAGSQTMINPAGAVSDRVLPQVVPSYSVELGALASLFGIGTVYFTMGQTVAGGIVPTEPSFNHKFAQGYAQKILKTINGSEFNSFALAMVTASAAEGEPLSEKRAQQLINVIKIVMLSSALILLYKTESSFKGFGGGITEIEFADLVSGRNIGAKEDQAAELGAKIKELLKTLPKLQSTRLFQALLEYVASAPATSSLINLDSVFTGVGKRIATPEVRG